MAATLFVGNAIKDLLSAPRPLSVEYGVEKLRFLTGSSEEAEKNAKVLAQRGAGLGRHRAPRPSGFSAPVGLHGPLPACSGACSADPATGPRAACNDL